MEMHLILQYKPTHFCKHAPLFIVNNSEGKKMGAY